jgi:peptidoglycan/xylan/chitin deacetylase (PgdA/CDA1 family)
VPSARVPCRVALVVVCAVAIAACGGGLPRAQPHGDAQTSPATSQLAGTANTVAPATTRAGSTATVPEATVAGASTTTAPLAGAPALQIRKGTNGRKVVALSFDAGSDTGFTTQILDILKTENVKASFGVTGKWAEQNPDIFRRIVTEGHHLINHTYDHKSWTGFSSSTMLLNREARIAELDKAEQVFKTLGGVTAKPWFRPPYGDVDNDTDKLLGQMGYKYDALWTVDSLGWMGKTVPQIVEICRKGFVPGAILLFHVGSQSQDANALVQIIKEIRAAGLQPGSVLDVV